MVNLRCCSGSILLGFCFVIAGVVQADTVAYWRFEGTNFLYDTVGNHMLTNTGSVQQVESPFRNPLPQTDAVNTNAASFSGLNYLTSTVGNPDFVSNRFTVEAFFNASDLSGTSTRMIAGVWGTLDTANQSYIFGTRSGRLLLQFRPGSSAAVSFSAFTLSTGINYYAAAAVDLTDDTGVTAITLYLMDLSTGIMQIANSGRLLSSLNTGNDVFSIGATTTPSAYHIGIIDEVRFSNVKLTQAELLISPPPSPPPPPGETPTWQEFRQARFGPDVLASANPFADPDGDGIINLFEHAFGGDPNVPATAHLPAWDFSAVPDTLKVSYPKSADDVAYAAQWSPDLLSASWSSAAFSEEMQDPDSMWYSRTLALGEPPPRAFARLGISLHDSPNLLSYPQAGGFRGIWFSLNAPLEYGWRYSGGLGTYTANHVPMAHYVPAVNRTYLTWGGTTAANERRLLILVSYFDHNTGLVARPVVVMNKWADQGGVNDPHDNASMSIDEEGYIWIFVSGRGSTRLGRVYRSKVPYGIQDWERLQEWEFTYPQPWWFEGKGFLFTYTRYSGGNPTARELFWRTSRNGTSHGAPRKNSQASADITRPAHRSATVS
jgi:hypothetical protein